MIDCFTEASSEMLSVEGRLSGSRFTEQRNRSDGEMDAHQGQEEVRRRSIKEVTDIRETRWRLSWFCCVSVSGVGQTDEL